MAGVDEKEDSTLAPDEAFTVLGNEVRIEILRALADAGEPLSFSGLFDQVDYDTASNFSYHLDKLTQHFVRKTDEGYGLTRAGERVVEAVLSGAVTEAPVIERTRVDQDCHFCGAPIEIRYHQERLERFCTECPGMWGSRDRGFLGSLALPPVGLEGRSEEEAVRAAWTWRNLTIFALGAGLCPRCSARLERELVLCDSHDVPESDELCDECGNRFATRVRCRCPTCILDLRGSLPLVFVDHTEFQAFMTRHGYNLVSPDSIAAVQRFIDSHEEEVLSVDPFRARLTFSADGESLTLTVDEDLEVVETVLTGCQEGTDEGGRSGNDGQSDGASGRPSTGL